MNENELKKGTKIKVAIITVLLMLTALAGISYAYFSIQVIGNEEASSVTISTATLSLEYTDGVTISGSNIYPGWSQTKTISVENTGTVTSDYIIKWRELTNGIINGELVMSATCVASTGSCSALPERVVHSSNTQITDAYMYGPMTIAPGVTHTYTVTFTFKETSSNQNYNQGKTFSGTLNIADGTATDSSLFSYTVSNDEVTITGFDSSLNPTGGVTDIDKCTSYLEANLGNPYWGKTPQHYCEGGTGYGPGYTITIEKIIKDNIPASDYEEAGVYYIDNRPKSIIIPSTINSKPVTSIGNYAFNNNQLTSLVIPSSVTTIGSDAFSNNQLTSLVIPSSVTTIRNYAFRSNQLVSVVIPNGVTSIGNYAFFTNQLISVVIPNGVTNIWNGTFGGNKLTSVIIPNGVTTIGDPSGGSGAFANNQLTSIVIPNSVTAIYSGAFQNNQLTSVVIPNSVTSIGACAFNNNKLPDNQAFIYIRTDTNNDGIAEIDYTSIVSYGGANKNIIIPSGVTRIVNNAFASNQLTSVVIPNSVTTIYDYAFSNNQLTSVTIEGKSSSSDFTTYSPNWGWASGYSDSDIVWTGSGS